MRNEVLRMEKVTLREHDLTLLDHFNLHVFEGEIMGLLPLDSHGLTALLDLLTENLPLHYGYVFYREKQINSWRNPHPCYNRISVIQAKSCLVDGLSVADNIFVLRPGFHGHMMKPKSFRTQLEPFMRSVGIHIDADARVEELSVFQRFVVELLKAIVAGNKIIILNEIGTLISESELKKLHVILRHYAQRGYSFLYICFHFEELLQICDRTALMMNGRVVKQLQGDEMDARFLFPYSEAYSSMVNRQSAHDGRGGAPRREVFSARGLCAGELQDLSFSVAQGECLVLQDMDNHFIDSFLRLLANPQALYRGSLTLDGSPLASGCDRRYAVVQDHPGKTMVFSGLNYLDNLIFTMDHRLKHVWLSGRVRRGLKKAYGEWIGADLIERRVDELNELERCELVYRRILLQSPRVVFCIQPFRMAAVEMRMCIWKCLESFIDHGIAVVILAVNLADSLSLADRLVRVSEGKEQEVFTREHFDELPTLAPWIDQHRRREE